MNVSRMRAEDTKPDPANYPEGEIDANFLKDYTAWTESIIHGSYDIAGGIFMLRAVSSVASIGLIGMGNDYKEKMANLWKELSLYPDGSPVVSAALDQFSTTYPGATWYPTAKTDWIAEKRNLRDFSEFSQALRDGELVTIDPEERAYRASVMEIQRGLWKQRDDLITSFGGTAPELLSNWFEYQEDLTALKMREDYVWRWVGQQPWGKGVVEWWDRIHEKGAEKGENWYQAELLSETLFNMDLLEGAVFTENGIRQGSYSDARRAMYDKLDELRDASEQQDTEYSKISGQLDWYFRNVMDPFLTQREAVFTASEQVDQAAEKGPYYAQIADLANGQRRRRYQGETYITAEQFLYVSRSEEEQAATRLTWATRPPQWLSAFSFQTTYPDIKVAKPKLVKFFAEVNRIENEKDDFIRNNAISPQSTVGQALESRARLETEQLARDMGMERIWAMESLTPAQRIIEAKLFQDADLVYFAERGAELEGRFDLIRGAGGEIPYPVSTYEYRNFALAVDAARLSNTSLDDFLTGVEATLGEEGKPMPSWDMYQQVFFGQFSYPRPLPSETQAGGGVSVTVGT